MSNILLSVAMNEMGLTGAERMEKQICLVRKPTSRFEMKKPGINPALVN